MNTFLEIPLIGRLALVYLMGLVAASIINWGIFQLSYFHRHLGPWAHPGSAPPKPNSTESNSPASGNGAQQAAGGTKRLPWHYRLPVIGWFTLLTSPGIAKDTNTSRLCALRSLVIDIVFPLAIVALYIYEIQGGMLPASGTARQLVATLQPVLHGQFLAHFLLITLLMIATFIDFDEQLIPDWVTVPGTVAGLIGALFVPGWHLLYVQRTALQTNVIELNACSPHTWSDWLNGPYGLAVALACYLGWCFALTDRRWIMRRGLKKAVTYFFVGMVRNRIWFTAVVVLALVGAGLITAAFYASSPSSTSGSAAGSLDRWMQLQSGLIGLAVSGGSVWAARVVARGALGVEALGFGDVTLMAMIGVYVGWQPSLLIFFLAPMIALLFVLVAYMLTGENAFPYGPYLSMATVVLIVSWYWLWERWAKPLFILGNTLVIILVGSLVMFGVILGLWRWIRDRFLFPEESR